MRKSPVVDQTARFFSKVHSGGVCWEWEGSLTPDGYGRHWIDRKGPLAHRWVWEHLVGPIPEGYEIDHLCFNRKCVNPDHLEPVTGEVNRSRIMKDVVAIRVANKTHCKQGHELSPDNLLFRKTANNARLCKTCSRASNARRYQKSKLRV